MSTNKDTDRDGSSKNEQLIKTITAFYDEFSTDQLSRLSDIYHDDVTFTDPIHQVQTLDDLTSYFKGIMTNVERCEFAFTEHVLADNNLFLAWQMRLAHPKLAKGREIVMPGVSQFKLRDGKVAEQQDFYDMGAMIYEHVPVLGWAINKVKQRLVDA